MHINSIILKKSHFTESKQQSELRKRESEILKKLDFEEGGKMIVKCYLQSPRVLYAIEIELLANNKVRLNGYFDDGEAHQYYNDILYLEAIDIYFEVQRIH